VSAYEVLSDAEQRRLYDAATDTQLPRVLRRAAHAAQQDTASTAGATGTAPEQDAGTAAAACWGSSLQALYSHSSTGLRSNGSCSYYRHLTELHPSRPSLMFPPARSPSFRVPVCRTLPAPSFPFCHVTPPPTLAHGPYCLTTTTTTPHCLMHKSAPDASLNWRWGLADWARHGPAASDPLVTADAAAAAAAGSSGSLRVSVLGALQRHQQDLEVELHSALMTAFLGPRWGRPCTVLRQQLRVHCCCLKPLALLACCIAFLSMCVVYWMKAGLHQHPS